jgi:two-component system response regulator MprA
MDNAAVGTESRGYILIVEDDALCARALSHCLASQGYRTTIANNGAEGIAMFRAERPDLALVDVLLPKKDGFDVCSELKSLDGNTPILLMSGAYHSDKIGEKFARNVHADGFLRKPFDFATLVSRVSELVGS